MGNNHGAFTNEKLEEFQDCTYFSSRQIKRLYKRFSGINPQRINPKLADLKTRYVVYVSSGLDELNLAAVCFV